MFGTRRHTASWFVSMFVALSALVLATSGCADPGHTEPDRPVPSTSATSAATGSGSDLHSTR
ncbi:MAG: hypothetical protein ACRDRL_23475, partial [Sciscionella sp.]